MEIPDGNYTITMLENASQGRLEADEAGANFSEGGGVPIDKFTLCYDNV